MSGEAHIITNPNDTQRASYSRLLLEGKSFNGGKLGSDFLEGVRCFRTRPLPRRRGRQTACLICGTPPRHQLFTHKWRRRSQLSQLLVALRSAVIQVLMSSRFSSGSQKDGVVIPRTDARRVRGAPLRNEPQASRRRRRLPNWRGENQPYFPAGASLADSAKIRRSGAPGRSSLPLPPGAPHSRSIVTTAFFSSLRPGILRFCGERTRQSAEGFTCRLMVGDNTTGGGSSSAMLAPLLAESARPMLLTPPV